MTQYTEADFTPYFPPEIKPVHIGMYKTRYRLPCAICYGDNYWNGREWLDAGSIGGPRLFQDCEWRGLKVKP